MLQNTLRANAGARASASELKFRPLTVDDFGRFLAIVSLSAAIALFFGWLTFSDSGRSAASRFGSGWDCTSLGRGGAHCVRHSASDGPYNPGLDPDRDCSGEIELRLQREGAEQVKGFSND